MKRINRVSDEKVLNRINENITHLNVTVKRKADWIGHITRGKGILKSD